MEPIRVLIIDDDKDVCALVKHRLTLDNEGEFDVVTMSEQFDRLDSPGTFVAFDCLILDMWLSPDGILKEFPIAHKIFRRARDDNPEMPIVVFSAVIGLQKRQDIEDEADMVLVKPSIDQIAGIIKTVTYNRRSTDFFKRKNCV